MKIIWHLRLGLLLPQRKSRTAAEEQHKQRHRPQGREQLGRGETRRGPSPIKPPNTVFGLLCDRAVGVDPAYASSHTKPLPEGGQRCTANGQPARASRPAQGPPHPLRHLEVPPATKSEQRMRRSLEMACLCRGTTMPFKRVLCDDDLPQISGCPFWRCHRPSKATSGPAHPTARRGPSGPPTHRGLRSHNGPAPECSRSTIAGCGGPRARAPPQQAWVSSLYLPSRRERQWRPPPERKGA